MYSGRKSEKRILSRWTMGLWLRGHVQISFLIYMLWLQVVLVGCKGKITGRAICESTGLGKPAQVTCHYGLNVEEARDVIAVSLLHEKDGKQERVVECHRYRNNGFDCLPNVGYNHSGTVSDRMIINIPGALPEHEGTYYCEIGIQQAEIQLDSCYLEYHESNDSTTSALPSKQDSDNHLKLESKNSTPPKRPPDDLPIECICAVTRNDSGTVVAIIVIIVLWTLLVVLFAVYYICIVHHILRRSRHKSHQGKNCSLYSPKNQDSGDDTD